MAEPLRIGIIGFGKIARDQHAPAIAGRPGLQLAAAVTRDGGQAGDVPVFADYRAMLREAALDAVAICTPPGPRYEIARVCLDGGLHLLLEKPPTATLGEIADLQARAAARGRTLFTTWHAQFNGAVQRAAEITRREGIASLRIAWFEDVEKWHPGQAWIWGPGGFGVFDAGINALSIATSLSPEPLLVHSAELVMHEGGQQPIAAAVAMHVPGAAGPIEARLDWRHKGDERWNIDIVTKAGTRLALSRGGSVLSIDGGAPMEGGEGEYPAIYARFESLVAAGESQVDAEPLRLASDIFLVARRVPETART